MSREACPRGVIFDPWVEKDPVDSAAGFWHNAFTMNAKILVGFLAVQSEMVLDGESVLEVDCFDFDAYKSLPQAVMYRGIIHALTGWNSDTSRACYKTGRALARAC